MSRFKDDVSWNEAPKEKVSDKIHADAPENFKYAEDFFRKKKMLLGMTMKPTGTRENCIFMMHWRPMINETTPHFGSKASSSCYPVHIHQPRLSFMRELEDAYNHLFRQAHDYLESKKHHQIAMGV